MIDNDATFPILQAQLSAMGLSPAEIGNLVDCARADSRTKPTDMTMVPPASHGIVGDELDDELVLAKGDPLVQDGWARAFSAVEPETR